MFFIGALAHEELPNFFSWVIYFLDAFSVNKLTNFMSPIKIPEVLLAGKRIVSTQLTEIKSLNSPYIILCNSVASHCLALDKYISINNKQDSYDISKNSEKFSLDKEMENILVSINELKIKFVDG